MRVALAWGCGVGSVLALDALRAAGDDVTLVHAVVRAGDARAVPDFVVEAQAAALGLPIQLARGPAEIPALTAALRDAKVEAVAFGYVRGEENAGMFALSRAARDAGVEPMLPVRHVPPGEAARVFVASGGRAFVRAARPAERALLGRFLDGALIEEVDATLGRSGWAALRTLAVGGPPFLRDVEATAGEPEPAGDAWRLAVGLRGC
jgi:hypothetical protein